MTRPDCLGTVSGLSRNRPLRDKADDCLGSAPLPTGAETVSSPSATVAATVAEDGDGTSCCSTPGCDKKVRARGLCSTHYNQAHQADRHAKVEVVCGYCGEITLKGVTSRYEQRFCDFTCRDLWRIEADVNPRPSVRPYPRSPLPNDHPARWFGATCPVVYASCDCGTVFVKRGNRVTCSRRCLNRRHEARRRKAWGARHVRRRLAIFERDQWICHLCGEECNPAARVGYDPDAATVDHLVPRSMGGSDDPSNLKTAHSMCNTLRGVKPPPGGWGGDSTLQPPRTAGEGRLWPRGSKGHQVDAA